VRSENGVFGEEILFDGFAGDDEVSIRHGEDEGDHA
jgi:hypothetical protein